MCLLSHRNHIYYRVKRHTICKREGRGNSQPSLLGMPNRQTDKKKKNSRSQILFLKPENSEGKNRKTTSYTEVQKPDIATVSKRINEGEEANTWYMVDEI